MYVCVLCVPVVLSSCRVCTSGACISLTRCWCDEEQIVAGLGSNCGARCRALNVMGPTLSCRTEISVDGDNVDGESVPPTY